MGLADGNVSVIDSVPFTVGQKLITTCAVPPAGITDGVGPLWIVKSEAFVPPITPMPGVHDTFPLFVIVTVNVWHMPSVTGAVRAPVALAITPAPTPDSWVVTAFGPPVIVIVPFDAPNADGVKTTQNWVVPPAGMEALVTGGKSVYPVPGAEAV